MSLWLILKVILVLLFLAMFWRRTDWVWGIGLLTVATAVFVDTFLGVFGRGELVAEIGLLAYVVGGLLVGGAAVWLAGVTRPLVAAPASSQPVAAVYAPALAPLTAEQQPIYDLILSKLGGEDIVDLIFDMDWFEADILSPTRDMTQTIRNMVQVAHQRRQTNELTLAVERIFTPVPAENLPRLEKLNADSPPAVLRRYLLAFYFADQLRDMCEELGVDWELLGLGSKQAKVRNLLLHLRRRGRTAELIAVMQNANQPAN